MTNEFAHGVNLMVAGEDQVGPRLATLRPTVLVDELLDQVKDAVPCSDPVPKVIRGIGAGDWSNWWIPCALVASRAERVESGGGPFESGGHIHKIRIDGDMGDAASRSQQCVSRIAVLAVLRHRVLHILPRERILKFGGEDRNAVHEDCQIQTLLALRLIAKLPDNREEIGLV